MLGLGVDLTWPSMLGSRFAAARTNPNPNPNPITRFTWPSMLGSRFAAARTSESCASFFSRLSLMAC